MIKFAVMLLLVAIIVAVCAVAQGYAIAVLWGWFLAPIFEIRAISIPEAIGLSLIFGLMHARDPQKKSESESEAEMLVRLAAMSLAKPAIALLIGYVALAFA